MRHPLRLIPRLPALAAGCLTLALLAGCAGKTVQPTPPGRWSQAPRPTRVTTPWPSRISPASQQIPSFASLAPAVDRSIAYTAKKPPNALAVNQPGARLTWGQLHHALITFRRILPGLDRDPSILAKYFRWVPLQSDTLLTGYYAPTIDVSRTPNATYAWPIYRSPGSLRKRYSREQIDYHGALRGHGLEIAYAKDPIDVFFLHVQGSGRLRFVEDGSTTYVLFNGTNGRHYVGVGRVMVNNGCFPQEEMSMQRIRGYLKDHPSEVRAYLSQNPSYVFFKTSQTPPVGAMGVPVTPHCSVAVDPSFVPYGTLMVLDADLPGYQTPTPERFTGFIMAQDTGCMRGNHFDLYLGPGDKAGYQAGLMKGTAQAFILLPK